MLKVFSGIFVYISLFVLTACAQNHKENQTWLEKVQHAEKSIVVLNNQESFIPLQKLEILKIASVNLGFNDFSVFDSLLNKYKNVEEVSLAATQNRFELLHDNLRFFNTVIITTSDSALNDQAVTGFIQEIKKKKKVVIALFGAGESLKHLDDFNNTIVWSAEKTAEAGHVAAQIIFGGLGSQGKLFSNYSLKYKNGDGYSTHQTRLEYTVPEALGLNANRFIEIDKIANEAISNQATPGAVVLVAKNGKVIFNKAYGYHTYDKSRQTQVTDIYDLASITKIAATTVDAMKLYEEGKLDLQKNLSDYLYAAKNTNKAKVSVKDIMLHQAGFVSFIPFYKELKPSDYSRVYSENFSVKVADSFFITKNYYKNKMLPQMLNSGIKTSGKYEYSDLSMYFMKEIIESISEQTLPNYTQVNFYDKLGMYTTSFNPRDRFDKYTIVPTEQDNYFRKTLLWGNVHDQGAAMVGGIAGHAGLFSNSTDLATIFQMLLNKGSYGGENYLKPETVDLFTSKQSTVSRRGLGFDRWDPDRTKKYPSELASSQTYGHTGYTGTCVWVDPAEDLIYIFLSNRVHPAVSNKLSSLNIRSRIQDVIYKAIKNSEQ